MTSDTWTLSKEASSASLRSVSGQQRVADAAERLRRGLVTSSVTSVR